MRGQGTPTKDICTSLGNQEWTPIEDSGSVVPPGINTNYSDENVWGTGTPSRGNKLGSKAL